MDKELYKDMLQVLSDSTDADLCIINKSLPELAESLTAKIESRYKVIAEGEVTYKGTELMGTIGKDFMDVAMKKLHGQKGKLIWKEAK